MAVKVQRPGIQEVIEADLEILGWIARQAERRVPQFAGYDLVGLAQEFGRSLRNELDFVHEGQNCDICRRNFKGDEHVHIPGIFWDYTRRRVLTMEMIHGIKVNDIPALEQAGHNRRDIARTGCTAYMRMVLEHGFFQADPHPGNLLVMADGRIAILDYGMFSRLSRDDRHMMFDFMLAAYQRQADVLARLMTESGITGAESDQDRLRSDVQDILDRYYGLDLKNIAFGEAVRQLMTVARNHKIHLPPGFNLLLRGLATIEGLGTVIDPEFNFVKEMEPFIEAEARRQFGPLGWLRSISHSRIELEETLRNLPRDLRLIVDRLKKGQLELALNPEEFRKIGTSLERSNNRLAMAIVIAAIIVASALMVFASPTALKGLVPVIGILGFVAAAVLGFWLLINTLRGGKF